ncbi:MAG: ribonuclease Z [archaeon]
MDIRFIGVGEAFDESQRNTSIFIEDIGLLLDCGFSAIQGIWKEGLYKNIRAIYISHFHADHTFGIPSLLLRYHEEKRTEPLTIIGAKGIELYIRDLTSLAYATFIENLGFDLTFKEIDSKSKISLGKAELTFAKAEHAESSYSIRIDLEKKSLVYTGDTAYSKDIADLAKETDILVHEAYTFQKVKDEKGPKNHSSFLSVGLCAKNSRSKTLALVHISREVKDKTKSIKKEISQIYSGYVIFPKDGEKMTV